MGFFDDVIEDIKKQRIAKEEEKQRAKRDAESATDLTSKYIRIALNDFVPAAKELGLKYHDKTVLARYYKFPLFFHAWVLIGLVWIDENNCFYGKDEKNYSGRIIRITKEEAIRRIARDIYSDWTRDRDLSDNPQYRALQYSETIVKELVKRKFSNCLSNKHQRPNGPYDPNDL